MLNFSIKPNGLSNNYSKKLNENEILNSYSSKEYSFYPNPRMPLADINFTQHQGLFNMLISMTKQTVKDFTNNNNKKTSTSNVSKTKQQAKTYKQLSEIPAIFISDFEDVEPIEAIIEPTNKHYKFESLS